MMLRQRYVRLSSPPGLANDEALDSARTVEGFMGLAILI
jgi:hypothetical protein